MNSKLCTFATANAFLLEIGFVQDPKPQQVQYLLKEFNLALQLEHVVWGESTYCDIRIRAGKNNKMWFLYRCYTLDQLQLRLEATGCPVQQLLRLKRLTALLSE